MLRILPFRCSVQFGQCQRRQSFGYPLRATLRGVLVTLAGFRRAVAQSGLSLGQAGDLARSRACEVMERMVA